MKCHILSIARMIIFLVDIELGATSCWERVAYLITEPVTIAKSNIILDVKPWDDETDMAKLEECVRSIEMDGLLWGACKLQIANDWSRTCSSV